LKSPLIALMRKDLLQEWRQKHTLFGVALYVGCTVFAVYLMNGKPEGKVWNALFWVTQLFVSVNAAAKSFLQEPNERFRYYFTLAKPQTFFLAKLLYNLVLLLIMNLISLGLFMLLLGTPLSQTGLFLIISMLGSISLTVVFTFLSAIASRAQQQAAMMAILGFPLVLPMLLILSRLALKAVSPVFQPGWWQMAAMLCGLDIMVVMLGLVLFPFLWQE